MPYLVDFRYLISTSIPIPRQPHTDLQPRRQYLYSAAIRCLLVMPIVPTPDIFARAYLQVMMELIERRDIRRQYHYHIHRARWEYITKLHKPYCFPTAARRLVSRRCSAVALKGPVFDHCCKESSNISISREILGFVLVVCKVYLREVISRVWVNIE